MAFLYCEFCNSETVQNLSDVPSHNDRIRIILYPVEQIFVQRGRNEVTSAEFLIVQAQLTCSMRHGSIVEESLHGKGVRITIVSSGK